MSLDPTSARPRRKFSPLVDSLTVRARNALHAVGVDLYTATREDVQAGARLALESHVRGCGETTRMELTALRERLANSEETQFWSVTVSRNGEDYFAALRSRHVVAQFMAGQSVESLAEANGVTPSEIETALRRRATR